MPVPLWLIPLMVKGAAVVAGAAGVGAAAHGAKKMKDANDTVKAAHNRHERNMARFENENETTAKDMDKLGKLELEILHSFSEFSDVFEQVKNRPTFETYSKNGVTLPKYDGEKIKEVSVGAGVLLCSLGTAGLGAASSSAVASVGGAMATNAALASAGMVAGGGALGGVGMAAGVTALGVSTLGVGLLASGIIFNLTGGKLSDKADEAWSQMRKAERKIDTICNYLVDLRSTANSYYEALSKVNSIYQRHLNELKSIVTTLGHTDWNTFTPEEKKLTENSVLLVGLLYNMCKVELVLKSENENDINTINQAAIETSINNANAVLADKF